ncbi:MAG: hypothetical protein AB7Q17_12460 [Phycisphaerae bacterium]
MTHRWTIALLSGALAAAAALAAPPDDHALIAQAAADRQPSAAQPAHVAPQSPASPEATGEGDLTRAERRAASELLLAKARLEVVRARRAIVAEKYRDAAVRAVRVLDALRGLPADVDASEIELQAEGILARAARFGVDLASLTKVTLSSDNPPTADGAPASGLPAGASSSAGETGFVAPYPPRLDSQSRAAARIGRQYAGADARDIDTRGDADALRERTLARQTGETPGYRPGREVVDSDAVNDRIEQRIQYQDPLGDAIHEDEQRRLVEADETRIAGDRLVQYPPNWPELVARRAKWKDGVIARTAGQTDSQGREWYTAIYDIQDLTYVPPDFLPIEGLTLTEGARIAADRDALRWRSQIFGGYADDLAMGVPLLRFFGGVDDLEFRGPKYSAEKARQIGAMVQRFLQQRNFEPTVEVSAP